jgi:plasmid stability protein
MGDLLIRNIPDAIRQSLAERAERSGRSVSEDVTAILGDALQSSALKSESGTPSTLDALREIMMPESEEQAALYAEVMDEIELQRKSDFGRPIEDGE